MKETELTPFIYIWGHENDQLQIALQKPFKLYPILTNMKKILWENEDHLPSKRTRLL